MHVAHNFSLQDDKLDRAERAARAVEEIGASSKKNHKFFECAVICTYDQSLHSCRWSCVREYGEYRGSLDSFEFLPCVLFAVLVEFSLDVRAACQ